jgi:hypothetical protein
MDVFIRSALSILYVISVDSTNLVHLHVNHFCPIQPYKTSKLQVKRNVRQKPNKMHRNNPQTAQAKETTQKDTLNKQQQPTEWSAKRPRWTSQQQQQHS